jgi:saccharopine dehydrogenase (NAD+, L-lysine-forming)
MPARLAAFIVSSFVIPSMSHRVLIIGAGGVGRVVTHKCAQLPDVFGEIMLASRTKSKCDGIAAELKRPIQTAAVDADNVPELVKLLQELQA